ncbi:hypothetical protein GCM10022206_47570 [Streptomyces chiangmaiensis]
MRQAVTAAIPRPAAETAEQTVSAIIATSRVVIVRAGSVRPFHPAPPHTPRATVETDLREISGSAPPQGAAPSPPPGATGAAYASPVPVGSRLGHARKDWETVEHE